MQREFGSSLPRPPSFVLSIVGEKSVLWVISSISGNLLVPMQDGSKVRLTEPRSSRNVGNDSKLFLI